MKKILIFVIILQLFEVSYASPVLSTLALDKVAQGIRERTLDPNRVLKILTKYMLSDIQKIGLLSAIVNQGTPVNNYRSDIGMITQFSDKSIKIDNYLGRGGTFYLSRDKQEHFELDAGGKLLRSSLERAPRTPLHVFKTNFKSYTNSIDSAFGIYDAIQHIDDITYLKHNDGTLEKYYLVQNVDIPRAYVYLELYYPDNRVVQFDDNNWPKELSVTQRPELALSSAIMRVDSNAVLHVLQALKTRQNSYNAHVGFVGNHKLLLQALQKASEELTVQQKQDITVITKELLLAGAAVGHADRALLIDKSQVNDIFEQAFSDALCTVIERADRAAVDMLLSRLQQWDNKAHITNIVNSTTGQTPLVYAFTLALETQDRTRFERLLCAAQALINSGATLSNPAGQAFIQRHGNNYRNTILPVIRVPRLKLDAVRR